MASRGARKRNLLNRSMDLLKDVSDRVQKEAERAFRLSGLRVESSSLRRQRAEALRQLGEAVQQRLHAGKIACDELAPLSKRITDLDARIAAASREIDRLVGAARKRRVVSDDKAPRESKKLQIVRSEPHEKPGDPGWMDDEEILAASRPSPPEPPVPGDPLEDILGLAEEGSADASDGVESPADREDAEEAPEAGRRGKKGVGL